MSHCGKHVLIVRFDTDGVSTIHYGPRYSMFIFVLYFEQFFLRSYTINAEHEIGRHQTDAGMTGLAPMSSQQRTNVCQPRLAEGINPGSTMPWGDTRRHGMPFRQHNGSV